MIEWPLSIWVVAGIDRSSYVSGEPLSSDCAVSARNAAQRTAIGRASEGGGRRRRRAAGSGIPFSEVVIGPVETR